jgi:cell division protease FtsH
MAGPERKSRIISKEEKAIISYHESGHALLALVTPGAEPLHKVSILPRGMALGYTIRLPLEDRYIVRKEELLGRITGLLGGRVSEELIFNEVSTGAQNDLEVATAIARKMVTRFGMSEKMGNITFGHREEQIFLGRDMIEDRSYSDQTALLIDQEVRRIVDDCYKRAKGELEKHKDKLKVLAEKLLENEVMDVAEIRSLLGFAKDEAPK